MENKVATKENLIKRILEVRERLSFFGVTDIGLFGSFVRGEQTPSSDIDILVEFVPEKHTFDNFMEVSFLLEEILGRKVEVVTPEGLSPHIGPHILKEIERVPVAA
ncbi:MAG: nucleotidyltransferase family protein [Desulfosudaceae bacterium]